MTALDYLFLFRAFFGLYPRPVSRREYVNLTCDNAALASAVEQKERARVRAVAEIQRLQRELDDVQRAITVQLTGLAEPELYRVCYIEGQGFGYMDPAGWVRVPGWARARVRVLAVCPSEAIAQTIVKCLSQDWRDDGTYYNLWTGKTHWGDR